LRIAAAFDLEAEEDEEETLAVEASREAKPSRTTAVVVPGVKSSDSTKPPVRADAPSVVGGGGLVGLAVDPSEGKSGFLMTDNLPTRDARIAERFRRSVV
jgi:hypothetical protein